MMDLQTRREFLEFLGKSAAAASIMSAVPFLSSCATTGEKKLVTALPFKAIKPLIKDDIVLAEGFKWQMLISWGEVINTRGEAFGTNNDYLAFFRLNDEGTDALLWSNHESLHPLFVSGFTKGAERTEEQVIKEQSSVGGSFVRIQKDLSDGSWVVLKNDALNRRISARTEIKLVTERPIRGSRKAIGTMGNCAGGITPWGTLLTCEENYDDFYGEAVTDQNGKRTIEESRFGWEKFFNYPPEHYGWVVEVNPLSGEAKKLTALGRFAHEGATVRPAADGRCVVYSGDDAEDQHVYKFIPSQKNSLEKGTLYVANTEKGQWISLSIKDQPVLKKRFKDQTDVLINCREAAKMLGATPLARPEDIEIDPQTGAVLVALTNSAKYGNFHGSILKIEEKNDDPFSLEFKSSTFISGGEQSGFACPDNFAFDRRGNLWMTSDISGRSIGKGPYAAFGNNGLFYIPLQGPNAGQVFQVASAPNDAEFTGPVFSTDGRTLFLAVQHPGEETKSLDNMTSHWPDGGKAVPRSSVITISGPALDALVAGAGVPPVVESPVLKPSLKKT